MSSQEIAEAILEGKAPWKQAALGPKPKERGILYSAPMIRALLAGQKTETRRLRGLKEINEAPDRWQLAAEENHYGWHFYRRDEGWKCYENRYIKCPYGKPGDLLWARETHAFYNLYGAALTAAEAKGRQHKVTVIYRANPEPYFYDGCNEEIEWNGPSGTPTGRPEQCRIYKPIEWKPSIHLPLWASRLTHRIIEARPVRLHTLTGEQAIAEGVGCPELECRQTCKFSCPGPAKQYEILWDHLNGEGSWAKNLWAWRLVFEEVKSP